MASTLNADNGVVSGAAGLKSTGDGSGILALQTNGTTSLSINTSQALGVGSTPSYGTSGQVLTSAGSGSAPTWSAAPVTSPGGSTTQVQFNSSGSFAGSANLTFDGTTLTAAGLAGPHNGTVGATTPSTGAFTTLSASSTVSGTGFSTYLASPPAIGSTAANTGAFTTVTASSTVTGTALIPSGSSVPSNGIYLSAANTVAFATNTTARGNINATGNWTISAPSSGAALTVSAVTGGATNAGITLNGSGATPPVAVTFSATAMTLDCTRSNVFTTTFTANVTTAPTISNPQDGQTINWFITQDATGSRTMTWPTSFKWPGGTAGVLSTAANSVDLLITTYRSSTGFWYCSLSKAFA